MRHSFFTMIVAVLALTTLSACDKPRIESPDSESYGKTITPDWHVPDEHQDKPEEFKPLDENN